MARNDELFEASLTTFKGKDVEADNITHYSNRCVNAEVDRVTAASIMSRRLNRVIQPSEMKQIAIAVRTEEGNELVQWNRWEIDNFYEGGNRLRFADWDFSNGVYATDEESYEFIGLYWWYDLE